MELATIAILVLVAAAAIVALVVMQKRKKESFQPMRPGHSADEGSFNRFTTMLAQLPLWPGSS